MGTAKYLGDTKGSGPLHGQSRKTSGLKNKTVCAPIRKRPAKLYRDGAWLFELYLAFMNESAPGWLKSGAMG